MFTDIFSIGLKREKQLAYLLVTTMKLVNRLFFAVLVVHAFLIVNAEIQCAAWGDRAATWTGKNYYIKTISVASNDVPGGVDGVQEQCCEVCNTTKSCLNWYVDFYFYKDQKNDTLDKYKK